MLPFEFPRTYCEEIRRRYADRICYRRFDGVQSQREHEGVRDKGGTAGHSIYGPYDETNGDSQENTAYARHFPPYSRFNSLAVRLDW